jgi:F0F1-type ATP synthase assembly protein I
MISGMAVWGGVGWLLDRWLDTRVFAPVGILLGVSIAIYVVVVRYGGADPTLGRGTGKSGKTGRTSSTAGGRRSRPGTQKGRE